MSKLVRRLDINANQLARWIRERCEARRAVVASESEAFVALPVAAVASADPVQDHAEYPVSADHASGIDCEAAAC